MTHVQTRKLVLAALCLALCLVLPFLTGQIPQIGNALSPMHIPVFLCGFVCGWQYGLAVGLIAPPLRYLLFGMPPIFPTGAAMAVELAVYGLVSALMYRALKGKNRYARICCALIVAMICGRLAWGAARWIFAGASGGSFTFSAFLAGAVTNAVPGIILHIVLVPLVVLALQRAHLMDE